MRRACVYFGTDVPEARWSTTLRAADVVLEPFHPLVAYGGFADRFPHARRYVYVNPTSVDPWLLAEGGRTAPVVGWDARWNLPRIDPATAEGMRWAVSRAVEAFEADDGRSRGLFVDDLDRLLPDQAEVALRFLNEVEREAGRQVHWFVNRGFALWDGVERLDAVLLEDMAPSVTRHAPAPEIRWVREQVIPAVDRARARGAAVHAVAYADQRPLLTRAPDLALERDLAARIDSTVLDVGRAASSWEVFA